VKTKTERDKTEKNEKSASAFPSRDERLAAGKALREAVPRARHAGWKPPAKGRDPVDILKESNRDRLPRAMVHEAFRPGRFSMAVIELDSPFG
jgi:hypothetical protein